MERDEVYVPKSKAQVGLDDHDDIAGDAPFYTLFMLVRQQVLALPLYLCECYCDVSLHLTSTSPVAVINVSGQMKYPATTSHYNRAWSTYRTTTHF